VRVLTDPPRLDLGSWSSNHGAVPLPPRPPVSDTTAIVNYVRNRGSVDYPLESVPGEFVVWRRRLRLEAKDLGMRVSVRRLTGLLVVLNPDHVPSEDEKRALMDVMNALSAQMLGSEDSPVPTFEQALERRRRQRLRVVRR
jgi:hypothetical protein